MTYGRLFMPDVGGGELDSVGGCFDRRWLGLGEQVALFEKEWSERFQGAKTIAVNSGTAALHLAVSSLSKWSNSRGYVLVPSLTFSATAMAPIYNGLQPKFVDIDPETKQISIEALERAFDERCVGVIAVHYAGHPCEIDKIAEWCRQKKIWLIEDCAHTIGSVYRGTPLGLWGDVGCFSFEEKKIMTTGDGGLLVAKQPSVLEGVSAKRWVGIDRDSWKAAQGYVDVNDRNAHWFYEINDIGYKYNMNDLAASIGRAQLKRLSELLTVRAEILVRYKMLLNNPAVREALPYDPRAYCYQMFVVQTAARDSLMYELKNKGVATGCHYTPLNEQPFFRKYPGGTPVAAQVAREIITLPFHTQLKHTDVEFICSVINSWSSDR